MVDADQNNALIKPFVIEEFQEALFQMNPDKASGSDGFNPGFYQKFWGVLKDEIFDACVSWLTHSNLPNELKSTNIVLVPNVENPTMMKDLRPIALCNVIYKVLSKVLCNRLKRTLPHLIDKSQSTFVEGRSIQDNFLIAFEAIHSMKRKTRGRKGEIAFKIDISKAYDRVDWNYLEAVLLRLGFCETWTRWMMMCVRSVEYNVVLNHELVGPILPGRGLRQEDPLSPYLFILCAEGLLALLNFEVRKGELHGIKFGRSGPAVNHLMFADDCLFFCRATQNEIVRLKDCITTYGRASGQLINYQKSGIFFSKNVAGEERSMLSNLLQVTQPLNTGSYLGLPSLIGRSKRSIFNYLRERLWSRIQGWRGKNLSKSDELQKMMNSFWWGNKRDASRCINWLKWEKLCVRKEIGGMGFRSLQLFNLAMLGKFGWHLLSDPDALVCQVLKAKYFPRGNFLNANCGHSPSFTWRSIWSSQDIVRRGTRWRIGNGEKVKVVNEPWLRRDDNFYVSSIPLEEYGDLMVKDLFIPGTREWDVEIIEDIFDQEESKEVLRIPINPTAGDDILMWHYTKDGIYSVRSAYVLSCSLTIDDMYGVQGKWNLIWKLKFLQGLNPLFGGLLGIVSRRRKISSYGVFKWLDHVIFVRSATRIYGTVLLNVLIQRDVGKQLETQIYSGEL